MEMSFSIFGRLVFGLPVGRKLIADVETSVGKKLILKSFGRCFQMYSLHVESVQENVSRSHVSENPLI